MSSPEARALLGPMRQIGYLVPDVEAAAYTWLGRFGVGPWKIKNNLGFTTCQYRGAVIDIRFSLGTAYSGEIEIKLMTQTAGPASVYSDWVDSSGAGIHHLCFYPADLAAARDHMVAQGSEVVMEAMIGTTDVVYLGDDRGHLVELAAIPADAQAARAERIAAAAGWDGTDPVSIVNL